MGGWGEPFSRSKMKEVVFGCNNMVIEIHSCAQGVVRNHRRTAYFWSYSPTAVDQCPSTFSKHLSAGRCSGVGLRLSGRRSHASQCRT
jgi:hypothetical protein